MVIEIFKKENQREYFTQINEIPSTPFHQYSLADTYTENI